MHASPSIVVNEQNVIYLSSTEDMAVEWPYGMATKKFSTRTRREEINLPNLWPTGLREKGELPWGIATSEGLIRRQWSNPRRDYSECLAATIGSFAAPISTSSGSRCRTRPRWAPVGPRSLAAQPPDCRRTRSPRPRSAAVVCVESSCWEHAILRDSQKKQAY